MTESTTTPEAKAAKVFTVIDDMDSRRLFDSTAEATAYLEKCSGDFADFGNHPLAFVGLTEEGELDPEVYTDAMQVAVAVLTQRPERGDPNATSSVKAIVIFPSPRLETVLDSATGRVWLASIMQKEINHVAVRGLRKAESASDIADAIQAMPTTLDAYTTSGRESTGGILESFNALWQIIKKAIGEKNKNFAIANLSKKELRKSMESASYAAAMYPKLEDRTNKKGEPESLFEVGAKFGQALAKAQSLDSTIFDRMLETRSSKTIELADDDDSGEFDLDAMTAKLAAPADAPAEESTSVADTDGAAE